MPLLAVTLASFMFLMPNLNTPPSARSGTLPEPHRHSRAPCAWPAVRCSARS
jgi:hypothetical protein